MWQSYNHDKNYIQTITDNKSYVVSYLLRYDTALPFPFCKYAFSHMLLLHHLITITILYYIQNERSKAYIFFDKYLVIKKTMVSKNSIDIDATICMQSFFS